MLELLECVAEYGAIPDSVRYLIQDAQTDDHALKELANLLPGLDPVFEALLSTTQAVTLVNGGVKVNALLEVAEAVINHRIAEDRYGFILPAHHKQLKYLLIPVPRLQFS